MIHRYVLTGLSGLILAGCASVSTPPPIAESPVPRSTQIQAQAQTLATPLGLPVLKRKLAIARFSNETRYGRTFQTDANSDPLGKQTSDMLATRLVDSKHFLVFERPDVNRVLDEQQPSGNEGLIGVDTLITGSLTEFGRTTSGKSGFLSATKVQTARAKVEARLVDVHTGQVFFSTSGTGEASTESGEVAGFGSRADYDGTLNDRAIAAAISDMMGRLVTKLEERPWRTDILKVDGKQVYVSGGARQGLKVGDSLAVYQSGEKIKSGQTGFIIDLPPAKVATLRVAALFGDSEVNEGAVCELMTGKVCATGSMFVAQDGK